MPESLGHSLSGDHVLALVTDVAKGNKTPSTRSGTRQRRLTGSDRNQTLAEGLR